MSIEVDLEIVPIIKNSPVNPGETLNVEIYFSGTGIPKDAKLHVQHPYPEIVSSPDDVIVSQSIKINNEGEIVTGNRAKYRVANENISINGFTSGVSPAFFNPIDNNSGKIEQIYAEKKHDGLAPIDFSLKTYSDAQPGDYDIIFTLTYSDGSEIRQESESIHFHINNFYEQHKLALSLFSFSTIFYLINEALGFVQLSCLLSSDAATVLVLSVFLLTTFYLCSDITH